MTDPIMSKNTAHGRYYQHPRNGFGAVPSITNIKNVKSIDALQYVAARNAAEYAYDNAAAWAQLDRETAVRLIKGGAWGDRNDPRKPSNIGDYVHSQIENYIKRGTPPPADEEHSAEFIREIFTAREIEAAPKHLKSAARTVLQMIGRFFEFVGDGEANHRLRFIDAEFSVWSYKHEYAGTADGACWYDGKLTLFDTKTGKAAYPDTAMQLAALAKADVILRPDGTEFPIPPFTEFRILHLRPQSWKFIPVRNIDEAFQAFLGLKACFDWEVNHSPTTLEFTG